jgi:hypothetical protein
MVLTAALTTALGAVTLTAQAQLRPEVAKPMQQAADALKAGKTAVALQKIKEADAVANKNPAEQLLIHRMRGSAAQRAGDNATAIASFEAALAMGKLSNAEQAQIAESLAFAYSQQKNFAKTTEYALRAKQLGGGSPQLNQLLDYVRAQSGDYSTIARDAAAAVAAAEKDGKKPAEDDLLRLADAYKRMENKPGYASALEKLVMFYPKKDYWSAHLVNVQRRQGFSDRLGLDLMRLRLRHGIIATADEYMEMAQLALQAGLPAEAKDIMAKGYAAGVLGSGDQAERHKRLSDLVAKTEADVNGNLDKLVADASTLRDGNDLVKAGMIYASRGDGAKAAELIEKGIAKGNLKRPDDAKLRLGLAQLMTPALKAKGAQTLRAIDAKDGTADVARLWLIGG